MDRPFLSLPRTVRRSRLSACCGQHQLRSRAQTYEDAWPGLGRLGQLLTGSTERGEDLAQQVRLALLSKPDVEHVEAYLRRSMVNLAITSGRRLVRERLNIATLRPAVVLQPEHDDLWPLAVRLPARQRAVLVLRHHEDLSEAEIAAVLGCPPGTVKSLASGALAVLRQQVSS